MTHFNSLRVLTYFSFPLKFYGRVHVGITNDVYSPFEAGLNQLTLAKDWTQLLWSPWNKI